MLLTFVALGVACVVLAFFIERLRMCISTQGEMDEEDPNYSAD